MFCCPSPRSEDSSIEEHNENGGGKSQGQTESTTTMNPNNEKEASKTITSGKAMRRLKDQRWESLHLLRGTHDPLSICSPESVPRLAKDEMYAKDLLEAWNKDYEEVAPSQDMNNEDEEGIKSALHASFSGDPSSPSSRRRTKEDSYGCVFPYTGNDGEEFGGYLVVPQHLHRNNFEVVQKVPVVIMFHTGAGPQDIFNRYQADKLAREEIWGTQGCIVFIADIIVDTVGWSWGDRDRYWFKRKELLSLEERNGLKKRYRLQATLAPILKAVRSIDLADINRVAAIGFCLGGQPVLELARMQYDEILALVTFHGLFDGVTSSDEISSPKSSSWADKEPRREVLICNGKGDPLVPESDIHCAQKTFEDNGFNVNVLNFEHAVHNFSNPRTKYDDPDAPFRYDKNADMVSWNETIKLFKKVFELEK